MAVSAESLTCVVDEAMSLYSVPGVSIGVSHAGVRSFVCRGVTSVEDPLPVTPSTRFQVGSVTKTVTAAALLALVRHGDVDLDVPVVELLPGWQVREGSLLALVTSRMLLSHQCGFYGDWILYGAPAFGPGDDALAEMALALVDVPFVIRPGVAFSYSNTGYCLAGRLVAASVGATYEHAIDELVLQPAGLRESTFSFEDAITRRVAIGHHRTPDGATRVARGTEPWSPRWALQRAGNPAGGMISTASDQLTWAEALLGRTRFPDAELGDLMLTVQCASGGQGTHTGLGWHLRNIQGTAVWSHNGLTDGYVAHVLFVPELQLAATILTNHSMGGHLIDQVRTAILDTVDLHQEPPMFITPDAADLDHLPGAFADPIRHITIHRSTNGIDIAVLSRHHIEKPYAHPYRMAARPIERGRLLITDPEERKGPTIEYDTDHHNPTWVRLRGRIHPRT